MPKTSNLLNYFFTLFFILLPMSSISLHAKQENLANRNANPNINQKTYQKNSPAALSRDTAGNITIFAAGDSTAASYPERQAPMKGWVQCLPEFTIEGVNVKNRAACGRSTKSFRNEGRWEQILKDLKPGDFVLIQFGHNDQKENRPAAYAEAHTDFKKNLKKFVEEVREKGGNPVLVTSVTRRIFDAEENLTFSLKDYPECLRETARETQTPLVDLNLLTRRWVEEAGQEKSAKFFMNLQPGEAPNYPKGNRDNTHFHENGARAVAEMFVKEAKSKELEIGKLFK
ncbi:MAG: rhamnogalacturonan acetylesterase [Thermoguttaceae bacterium]|nr:rhamnogalacturonan acetylesterase [Thermoguttaceae bacterium]